jgi:hypothetical protein
VHEAGEARGDQPQAEAERHTEVLAVGLADRLRVFDESARQRKAHCLEDIGLSRRNSSQIFHSFALSW